MLRNIGFMAGKLLTLMLLSVEKLEANLSLHFRIFVECSGYEILVLSGKKSWLWL